MQYMSSLLPHKADHSNASHPNHTFMCMQLVYNVGRLIDALLGGGAQNYLEFKLLQHRCTCTSLRSFALKWGHCRVCWTAVSHSL